MGNDGNGPLPTLLPDCRQAISSSSLRWQSSVWLVVETNRTAASRTRSTEQTKMPRYIKSL